MPQRIFEIVYVQNFVSNSVIKQTINLIFFHNSQLIFIVKNCMIRLSLQLQSINIFHDDVILTNALR